MKGKMRSANLWAGPVLMLPLILSLPAHSRTLNENEECLKYKGDWISVDRLRSSYDNDAGLIEGSRWWGGWWRAGVCAVWRLGAGVLFCL